MTITEKQVTYVLKDFGGVSSLAPDYDPTPTQSVRVKNPTDNPQAGDVVTIEIIDSE